MNVTSSCSVDPQAVLGVQGGERKKTQTTPSNQRDIRPAGSFCGCGMQSTKRHVPPGARVARREGRARAKKETLDCTQVVGPRGGKEPRRKVRAACNTYICVCVCRPCLTFDRDHVIAFTISVLFSIADL